MFVLTFVFSRTALGVLALISLVSAAASQDARFFRIGTDAIDSTYYSIGGVVANAISNPSGSLPCDRGGSCGVPDLVVIAQTSNGSVSNVGAIASGSIDSGFVQSDVAHWAYTGTGIFEKETPLGSLRAIAKVYSESVHVVVRTKTGIESLRGLKGRKVSLDEKGSGALVDIRLILRAFGLYDTRHLRSSYLGNEAAALRLTAGKIDAFITVAGYPLPAVRFALEKSDARILPLEGETVEKFLLTHEYFSRDEIPTGFYGNTAPIPTISVNALWVVREKANEELIYQITRALWNKESRKLLNQRLNENRQMQTLTVLDGISIPLHPGARRYYREIGIAE